MADETMRQEIDVIESSKIYEGHIGMECKSKLKFQLFPLDLSFTIMAWQFNGHRSETCTMDADFFYILISISGIDTNTFHNLQLSVWIFFAKMFYKQNGMGIKFSLIAIQRLISRK